jgi:hypothetical protein
MKDQTLFEQAKNGLEQGEYETEIALLRESLTVPTKTGEKSKSKRP